MSKAKENKFRKRCIEQCISKKRACEIIGVTWHTLDNYLKEKVIPRFETVGKIERFLRGQDDTSTR